MIGAQDAERAVVESDVLFLRAQERVVDPKANVIGDARIWKQFDIVRVVAEASNLWNTRWIETGFVPMPSRWFRMGVEITAPL